MSTYNKVYRVTLSGGLIGLLGSSSKRALQMRLEEINAKGEEVAILKDDTTNLLQMILYLIILICTLLLWCPAPGYLIISRPIPKVGAQIRPQGGAGAGRQSPAAPKPTAEKRCQKCNAALIPGDAFCGDCGAPVG